MHSSGNEFIPVNLCKKIRSEVNALPLAIWLLAWLAMASAVAAEPPARVEILKLDFSGSTNWLLKPDGALEVNGKKIAAKVEGHGTGPQISLSSTTPRLGSACFITFARHKRKVI